MDLADEIRNAKSNPEKLEQLYQSAQREGHPEVFQSTILTCHENEPDNLLYAAWFHRLHRTIIN